MWGRPVTAKPEPPSPWRRGPASATGSAARLAVIAVVLVVGAGSASAGKLRKVRIDSEPTGAVVYINSEEEADRGTTPCTIELPPGTYDLILKKNDYNTEYTTLEVPKPGRRDKKKPVEVTVQLGKATALIEVVGAPARATVQIDDLPKLLASDYPNGFDVSAGGHLVVVELGDKTLLSQSIEVESGAVGTVTVRGRVAAADGDTGGDADGDPVDGDDGSGATTTVTAAVDPPAKRTGPVFTVGPLVDVAWRNFQYQGAPTGDRTTKTLPLTQDGPLLGLAIDINPFRLTRMRSLHPLAIVFAGGMGIPVGVDDDTGTLGADLETYWQRFQAGVRYRFGLGSIDLDLEAGYGGYVYRFSGNVNDIDRLPDASYQTVRFGGRLGVRLANGRFVPYLGGENRVVVSGGALEERFRNGSDAQGYAFRTGFEVSLFGGKLAGRAELNYSVFAWDLTPTPPDYMATGATDTLYHLSFVLGYAYQ